MEINILEIKNATIYKTKQMFIPVNILELETEKETFQFGFNPWANPFKFLKLDYKIKNVKLGMSKFSLILRIVAIITLIILILMKYL